MTPPASSSTATRNCRARAARRCGFSSTCFAATRRCSFCARADRGSASAQGALEHLIDISVGQWLQRLGPGRLDPPPRASAPYPAVPADLLHVIIELDAVAVPVEREGPVVDPRVKLRRDRVDQGDAPLLQERHRRAQLRVAADFDPEGGAGRILAQPQNTSQFAGVERDRMVLGAAAQEDAAGAAVFALLAAGKAEMLGVEPLGP